MMERQKRLNEVYQYLRQHRGIHTKSDFAESVHYGRTSMSAALNGNESYLTDSLFKNICDAFPQTFNLQYLLTGEGQLTCDTESDLGTSSTNFTKSEKDIIALATDLIVELESIRRQTKDELMLLAQARQSFESATVELQKLLTTLSHHNTHPNTHHPTIDSPHEYFPSLAAEDTETPPKNP